jgi:hypothetical protein
MREAIGDGACLDEKDMEGCSYLIEALFLEHYGIARLVIESGADANLHGRNRMIAINRGIGPIYLGGTMISTVRIVFVFVLLLIPQVSLADQIIYGVRIHLTDNGVLNGYIEIDLTDNGVLYGYEAEEDLHTCNDNKENNARWDLFLEKYRQHNTKGYNSVTFIREILPIKFNKRFSPFAAKSHVRKVRVKDIESIEAMCRNWDGFTTDNGIRTISDHMAQYVSDHNLVAFYIYDEDILLQQGKMKEDCGNCACISTYLSYNSKYTRSALIRLRRKIDKMSDGTLDKKNIIRFTECWD